MPSLTIRPAILADEPFVTLIVEQAYGHYIERIGRKPAPMTDNYIDYITAGQVWVLAQEQEQEQQLAGVIVLRSEPDHLLVSNVAVATAFQGQGMGRRLLDFADEHARQQGLTELRLYTNELMHENLLIYPKLGWQEYKRAEQDGFRRVYMRKYLQ
ncbi:GNAT family N-acetyltransferase [Pokkaliibacter plantistimulans]|uniref:GNAT family N-acetyltransferase n=1 Tax=Proteobacteria bacterium 228 TaxID=2083153 RepID=A0A2S5KPY1_9PROT|nr:GNAT family N-acetyltransferase [Pokkaliibacter plantistimulans]PPC76695.1 GNAT family N-acetyltransferase [Pokkaliibacter plantistimulans]